MDPRAIRMALGWNIPRMAGFMGKHRRTIERWESGAILMQETERRLMATLDAGELPTRYGLPSSPAQG